MKYISEVDVKVHNEIMRIYSSDEQNQRMDGEAISYEVDDFGDRIYTD